MKKIFQKSVIVLLLLVTVFFTYSIFKSIEKMHEASCLVLGKIK